MKSERSIANGIIPLAEYEPNSISRPSLGSIIDAVNQCDELEFDIYQRLGFWWDPLEGEIDELTVLRFCNSMGYSDDDEVAAAEAADQIVDSINIVRHLGRAISKVLTSEPSEKQVNQRALKDKLQAYMAKYPDDGYFANPDEITFGGIRDFMDEYREEMVGTHVTNTESPGVKFREHESAESILVEQSRGAFISSLDRLKEQGLVDDKQLERARQIATGIPITATDPLSEVMFNRHDEEDHSLGYFLPSDRTIFINPELIRYAIGHDFPDVDESKKNQIFERIVASTVFHELVHSISNDWYSSVTYEAFDYNNEKEGNATTFTVKGLFPRFIREALTEVIAHDLFTGIYGVEPEDYYAYPRERQIVQTMLERFDWSGAGSTEDTPETVYHKLKRAFLDSPSGIDDTKRPPETYLEWAKSLKVANAPGIIKRMATIDKQFGTGTLLRIVTSPIFTPGKDSLKFKGLLSSETLSLLTISATPPKTKARDIHSMPSSIAKIHQRAEKQRNRAQNALRQYGTVLGLIAKVIHGKYPTPAELEDENYQWGKLDKLLRAYIAEAQLEELVPELQITVQGFLNAFKYSQDS